VQTIGEAVQKVGFRETIRLLNLAVARIAAGRGLGCYGISAEDYWSECLFNGLFVRNLATAYGRADPDEAYTVGLLRFIGRLAIDEYIHEQGGGLFWRAEDPIAAWEKRNAGFVQSKAGALLLANWQFSSEMVQAIAGQDVPGEHIAGQDVPGELSERNWLAEAMYFASLFLPQGLGLPFPVDPAMSSAPFPVESDFMRQSGLTPSTVESVLATTREDYEQIRRTMGGSN